MRRYPRPRLLAVLCLGAAIALPWAGGCNWNKPIDAHLDGVTRPERAVLLMFFDGVDVGMVRRLAAAGELPNIRRHLLDRGAQVDYAVTDIPSITFAVSVSLATGQFAGHHEITGNRWFDRDTLKLEDYDGIVDYRRVDSSYRPPTLFELVPELYSVTVLTPVHRGSSRHFANWLSTGVTWFFSSMADVDALTVHRMDEIAQEARRIGRWPDIIWTYFPGVDEIGHRYGKDSPQYRAMVLNADEQVGRLVDALQQADMFDRTLMVLLSDHGHVVIDPSQHVHLRDALRGRFGLTVAYHSKVDGTYADRQRTFGDARVALTDEGNRRAVLHLRVGEAWADRPTLQQIERFHRDYGGPAVRDRAEPFWTLLSESIGRASRLLAVRDGPHRVLVTDGQGQGLVERRLGGGDGQVGWPIRTAQESFRYRVLEGADPLRLSEQAGAARLVDGNFHSSQQWLGATCDGPFPDFVSQIVDYFDSRRSGEIMIFSTDGWDFSEHCRGGHGGVGPEDMLVPLFFAGPGIPPGGHLRTARIVDVMPTLLEFLGRLDALQKAGPIDGVSRLEALRHSSPAPTTQAEGN